ncbi:MAG: hypothetical protein RR107_04200 [Clostridia bacterium]
MSQILTMINPAFQKISIEGGTRLAIAEMKLTLSKFVDNFEVKTREICGINYLQADFNGEISDVAIEKLSRLGSMFAMFELKGEGLYPLEKKKYSNLNPGLSSMLKYAGKTNEYFTKLLVHIAMLESNCKVMNAMHILDPVAGKGTTLFESVIGGCDAYGLEIGEKVVQETTVFFKKFLENDRIKHNYVFNRDGHRNETHTFEFADLNCELKTNPRKLVMGMGNCQFVDKIYKKDFFHAIVGDLPYGIMHGNVTNEKQGSLTRNPKELLTACLPAWREVLKSGGSLVLSWNSFTLPTVELRKTVESFGFEVLNGDLYDNFSHRVDQAIMRDVCVARKL